MSALRQARAIPLAAFSPLLALVLCLLIVVTNTSFAAPVRILVITPNTHLLPAAEAAFRAKYAHAEAIAEIEFSATASDPAQIARADVIQTWYVPSAMQRAIAPAMRAAHARGALLLATPTPDAEAAWGVRVDAARNDAARQYWEAGGADNVAGFFAYASAQRGAAIDVPAVRPAPAAGIYHPRATRPFESLDAYLAWYRDQGRPEGGMPADAPLVALAFYATNYRQRDLAHIDTLIAALERQGVRVVPVFGWPLSSLDAYLTTNGATKGGAKASPISLLLALNLTIPRAQDKDWLAAHRIRVMNLIATRDSRAAWAGDVRGIPGDRVPLLVTAPERAGATEPILFATQEDVDGARASAAVPERVDAIIGRVQRWLALRAKPAADRRVAILYYNNPPGRGNIGASYLATLPSLTAILERLRTAGYRTGTHLPDTATLTRLLEANGRNVETWSPGELDAMARAGHVTLLPVSQYRKWFDELPPAFRDAVTRAWGPPERNPLMLTRAGSSDPEPAFVIPGLRFGNLFVGPQPLRSTFARAQDTSHDLLTPPPHSYIAAYLWYRHAFGADAVVHVGRHGTLEWLPGKQVGLSGDDSAEVLLGGLPNPYVYIQDGGGEAIQAKRRSAAVLVSHLSPLLANAGQPPALAQLDTAIEQEAATRDASPELAREYRAQAIAQVRELGLDKQLGLDPNAPWDTIEPTIHAFLHRVEAEPVPLGIHALGEMPPLREQEDALATMLAARFSPAQARAIGAPRLREWAAALVAGREPSLDGLEASNNDTEAAGAAIATARTWLADLRISPSRELDGLVTVLSGDYLPSGPLGDPVRTPDSLPTGRNLHAFDGAQIPTRAAWALGKTMAEQTLARYRKENGTLPESVSMVLWYGETERHQGAMEAEAMYLMGVTPVWNARGIVEDVKLIPDSELGRPRVNVVLTISGIYRDGFGDKVALLDKAARLAAAAGDNAISRHDRAVKDALIAQGADADKASRLARARVFAAAPGSYAIGVQQMVEQSRDVQPPAGDAQPGTHGNRNALAELYLHAMNHAYSAEGWGDTGPAALASHLRGNQAVLFSRTSTLYGALDNDDTYQYAGGLVAATRAVTGQAPPLWLHNLRTAGDARTVDARTWLATELNARQWNPKWIVAMQRSGYAGAREIQREVEHLYGFQATVPEQMSGTFWQRTYDVYVADSLRLGMDRFFRASNPHAMQAMLARLIEVDRQGSYRFSERERAELLRRYAASVRHDGLSCTANTCGNPVLMAHIGRTLRQARVDPATMHDVGRQFAAAMVADPRPDATTQTATQTTTQTTTQTAPMHVVRAPATPHASPAFRPTPSLPRDASSTPTPAVSTPAAPIQGIRLEPVTPAAASPSPVAAPWRLGALAFTLLAFLMGAAAAWRRTVR